MCKSATYIFLASFLMGLLFSHKMAKGHSDAEILLAKMLRC